MRWIGFWCQEEDVELFIFLFIYSYLFLFKNIKAVQKAVPIYASDQSEVFWLAPKAGRVGRSAFGPEPPSNGGLECCGAARHC